MHRAVVEGLKYAAREGLHVHSPLPLLRGVAAVLTPQHHAPVPVLGVLESRPWANLPPSCQSHLSATVISHPRKSHLFTSHLVAAKLPASHRCGLLGLGFRVCWV
jgi:hypothetical protein